MEFTKEDNLHEIFAEEVIDMRETNELVSLLKLQDMLDVDPNTAFNIFNTLKKLNLGLIDNYTNTIEDEETIKLTWKRLLSFNSN